MRSTLTVLASLAAAAPLAAFLACSSSSSSGGGPNGDCDTGGADGGLCTPGTTPAYTSCADLTTPTVSFAQDVQPLFDKSCSLSTPGTCHAMQGSGTSTSYLVFLGSPDGGVDAAQVLSGLVGQPAIEDPKMNLITAGDPEHSFLMHKLDYDECQFASDCNPPKNPLFLNCGAGMPLVSGVVGPDTRDNIRRWIAQGAKNN